MPTWSAVDLRLPRESPEAERPSCPGAVRKPAQVRRRKTLQSRENAPQEPAERPQALVRESYVRPPRADGTAPLGRGDGSAKSRYAAAHLYPQRGSLDARSVMIVRSFLEHVPKCPCDSVTFCHTGDSVDHAAGFPCVMKEMGRDTYYLYTLSCANRIY